MPTMNEMVKRVIDGLRVMVDFVVKDNKLFIRGHKDQFVGREMSHFFQDGPIREIKRKIESYDAEKEELVVSEKVAFRKSAEFVTLKFKQDVEKKNDD